MYTYKATITAIISASVYLAIIDVGFGLNLLEKIKVSGVKITDENKALVCVTELLEDENVVVCPDQQLGDADKGCYLSSIILPNGNLLSEHLISEGLGEKSDNVE